MRQMLVSVGEQSGASDAPRASVAACCPTVSIISAAKGLAAKHMLRRHMSVHVCEQHAATVDAVKGFAALQCTTHSRVQHWEAGLLSRCPQSYCGNSNDSDVTDFETLWQETT